MESISRQPMKRDLSTQERKIGMGSISSTEGRVKYGDIEIPDWRITALGYAVIPIFLNDMKNNPEVRDRVLAKAEQIRAEREAREARA